MLVVVSEEMLDTLGVGANPFTISSEDIPALCAYLLAHAETPLTGVGPQGPVDDLEQSYTLYAVVKVEGFGKARSRVGTIIKMASEVALQFKNATIHWHGITEVDPEADIDVVMEQTL